MLGALNIPRCPQGYPVIVQAGGSDDMIGVAAEFAEVIFCAPLTLEAAQRFYASLKGRLAAHGRTPDDMKILPGLSTALVGRTDAEALENYRVSQFAYSSHRRPGNLSMVLGNVDLSPYPFDGPLPENLPRSNASLQIFQEVTSMAKREKPEHPPGSDRASPAHAPRRSSTDRPRPSPICMEEWFRKDGCDGFNIMPPFLPGALDDFVDLVISGIAAARFVPYRIRGPDLARKSRAPAAAEPPRLTGQRATRHRRGRVLHREDESD